MKRTWSWPTNFVIGLTVSWFALLSWYTITAFHKTNINRFDLGNVEQLIWNVTRGHGFVMTDPYGTATVSRFAFHSDPFLLTLVPFYALWPRAEMLILLQVAIIASGLVAIYLLAKHWLQSSWAGLVAAGIYAISPPVLWSAIEPVHAVGFALPLILWMIYAAERQRWIIMVILAILIAVTKEQAGLVIGLFGVWLGWRRRQPKWGMIVLVPAVAWSLISFFVLLPQYRSQAASGAEVYRSVLGTSAGSVVTGVVQHPLAAARTLLGGASRQYAVQLVGTTGGLALLNPISLMAVPDLVINGLSAKPQQHQLMFHYHGTLWPWLIAGMLLGWRWLLKWSPTRFRRILVIAIPFWLLVAATGMSYLYGPLPGARLDRLRFATWSNQYASMVHDLARQIPSDAPLTTTNNIGAQFARREHLYLFPNGLAESTYAIILEHHAPGVIATDEAIAAARQALEQDAKWQRLMQTGDLTVFKRTLD